MSDNLFLLKGEPNGEGINMSRCDLPNVPGMDDPTATQGIEPLWEDPTGSLMVASLIVVCAVLSGFIVGFCLGPAAFMVIR